MLLESDSNEIDYSELLERQILMIHSDRCFHVLSTMPLLVFDYNPKRTLEMINKKIEEGRTHS